MHKKYGIKPHLPLFKTSCVNLKESIVRVRPDVLSINDPNFIDQIYSGAGHRRDRYRASVDAIAAQGSVLTSKAHGLHRRRRAISNPYFSKQNVRCLEPVTHDTLANLLSLMDKWARMGGLLQSI
jgi:cytochrome P450